ncbi:MAG: hypothetical protein ABSD42_06885 [Candidatus Bathyarchaeia archaeon]|jgi:hypothetical protein
MKPANIFQLMLVLMLTVSATVIANLAYAQVSTPSVPQFTLQYVDRSYSIPPTYGTDPYTGKTIITNPGSYVDNRTIEVTIQNQPFTPYTSGNYTNRLYYNVRSKGHFENFTRDTDLGSNGLSGVAASSSSTTVVSFDIVGWNVPIGGQIDFQVQAFIGYTYYNEGQCYTANVVTLGESSWSNIQMITIGNETVTTSMPTPTTPIPTTPTSSSNPTTTTSPFQNPTATPIQVGSQGGVLGFDWQQNALIIMAVVIAILLFALVLVMQRKAAAK